MEKREVASDGFIRKRRIGLSYVRARVLALAVLSRPCCTMSAALETHFGADSSSMADQTHPDFSLSLGSSFSTPSRALPSSGINSMRLPSGSSRGTSSTNASSAPLSTPPPTSSAPVSVRKRGEEGITPLSSRLSNLLISGRDKDDDMINASAADEPIEGETDVLGTPGEKRRDAAAHGVLHGKRAVTAVGARPGAGPANKGVTLTLRDQEKVRIILVAYLLPIYRNLIKIYN